MEGTFRIILFCGSLPIPAQSMPNAFVHHQAQNFPKFSPGEQGIVIPKADEEVLVHDKVLLFLEMSSAPRRNPVEFLVWSGVPLPPLGRFLGTVAFP